MLTPEHVHVAAVRELLWHLEMERMRAIIRGAVLQGMPITQIAGEMGTADGGIRTFLRGRHLYAEDDEPFRRWCEGKQGPTVHIEQAALAVLAMDYPQSRRAGVRATITMLLRSLYVERGDRVPPWILEELEVWAKFPAGHSAYAADKGTNSEPALANFAVASPRRARRSRSAPRHLLSCGGALGSGL
jgi:hypothetical protein